MKQRPPAIAPLLRTDLQGELLAAVFLHPDREHTLTELAGLLDAGLSTVHAEVERLATAGLLLERRIGRARLVRCNPAHPLTPSLTELLTLTYGPPAVLPELLSRLKGLEAAYLYGSWAARRLGEPGPFPEDVDVLVIGAVTRRAAAKVQAEATAVLRREVNLTVLPRDEWDDPTTGFTRTVRDGALVPLPLSQ
ncbi:ArsR family transcriptional regulator [Tessaracoccus lubricantis]|uniref:ArsR family transcriptional regulator n=1 Tax=Tessaracoccus lubricantis TaxID=545543 RepID=A0ABP9F354_9ACTN